MCFFPFPGRCLIKKTIQDNSLKNVWDLVDGRTATSKVGSVGGGEMGMEWRKNFISWAITPLESFAAGDILLKRRTVRLPLAESRCRYLLDLQISPRKLYCETILLNHKNIQIVPSTIPAQERHRSTSSEMKISRNRNFPTSRYFNLQGVFSFDPIFTVASYFIFRFLIECLTLC